MCSAWAAAERAQWGVKVKEYVERQWTKILSGRVSLADFVFAKEVRLGTYRAAHGLVPPAAQVASRAMATDPRAEPRYGERVPYVVVHGEPGAQSPAPLLLHPPYSIMSVLVTDIAWLILRFFCGARNWHVSNPD